MQYAGDEALMGTFTSTEWWGHRDGATVTKHNIPRDHMIVQFVAMQQVEHSQNAGIKRVYYFNSAPFSRIQTGNWTAGDLTHWPINAGNCDWGACDQAPNINWIAPAFHALCAVEMFMADRCPVITRLGSVNVTERGGAHTAANIQWTSHWPGNGNINVYMEMAFITGFALSYIDSQYAGVRSFGSFQFRAYPRTIQTLMSKVSCCSRGYTNNPTLTDYCKDAGLLSVGGIATAACSNIMLPHCTGSTLLTDTCKTFCADTNNYCDVALNAFCQANPDNILTNPETCGCFMGAAFYDNYYNTLKGNNPALVVVPEFNYCSFPPCSNPTAIKVLNLKQGTLPDCPNIALCIQTVNFTNSGTVTGDVTINQSIAECGQLTEDTTTNTGTGTDTPPPLDATTMMVMVAAGVAGLILLVLIVVYLAIPDMSGGGGHGSKHKPTVTPPAAVKHAK